MAIISRLTLEEVVLELDYAGVSTDYWCTFCDKAPRLTIAELHPIAYKLRCGRCGRCGRSTWGGERQSIRWRVQGYDSTTVIYEGHLTSCPDTIKSHLQDLAKQHLRGEERRTPHLFEVTLNRGAPPSLPTSLRHRLPLELV